MPFAGSLCRKVKEFLHCGNGSAAVEYGVITTAMFLATIPAFLYVSTGILLKLRSIGDLCGSFG